jgi:hypothetical protein
MTYNFENPRTQYQNGLDFHLDTGASYFLTQQLNVGAVGYYFQQVKVGVADAAVDRAVSEPEIGKSGLVVVADGNVAGPVHHVIVDALIPLERRLRKEVAD